MNPRPPTLSRTRRIAWAGVGLLGVLLVGACDRSPTAPTVASVQVTAPDDVLRVGETLQLTATPRDGSGNVLQGLDVVWSSSNSDIATVSGNGTVTGVAEGQVTITAEVAGTTGQTVLLVVAPPEVSGITPELLRPGVEFTVTGTRFHSNPDNNRVFVFGARATVLEASETELVARVPDFVCGPEGLAPVVVSVEQQASLPFEHPFEPDETLDPAPGELVRITAPQARCLTLDGSLTGATYLVGVQSISGVVGARTPVRIHGFSGGQTGGLVAASTTGADSRIAGTREAAAPTSSLVRSSSGPTRMATPGLRQDLTGSFDPVARRWARHEAAERRIRAEEARVLESLLRWGGTRAGSVQVLEDAAGGTAGGALASTVPADVSQGDTIAIRVADLNGNICTDFETVQTVARHVGTRSVWLEDIANPDGGLTESDFELLSDDYDDEIHEELVAYFGEPTDIDDNGRIVVVATRRVNEMTANTLGFVVSSDFFPGDPPEGCPSSNGGEFYYTRAPDPQGTITDPEGESLTYTRQDALTDAPRLLAHEITHIIQFGRRLIEPPVVPSLEERWLLEGQAMLAEEVVGFRFSGYEPRSNLGRDVALGDHPPRDVPWFQNSFFDLALYYGAAFENNTPFKLDEAPHACGWLDLQNPEPCISGRIGYGVTWSLLRWLSDHMVDDERDFQRSIVESTSFGFGTLSQALGTEVRPLLAAWAASHYTDGRLVGGDPLLTFPSWNLRNIEEGLIEVARLTPEERGFETFERSLEVAAGSSTYQIFQGGAGRPPFAVSALTPEGTELPNTIQLWIVRLQ